MAALHSANALSCPCPLQQLGYCQGRRRLQLACILPASRRSIKLSTVCAAASYARVLAPIRATANKKSLIVPQRADGLANVLAMGTANPCNCVLQEDYPDWFFRVTESDHLTHLKAKMKKICGRSKIKKRFFYHDEDLIRSNRDFLDRMLPSLDARQDIAATAVPELAAAAASMAVAEWGRPASDITHLIFCTYSGAHMPGTDLRLASLLSLSPSVQRTMLYYNGCNSSSAALRLAKDIAENNRGARVLVAATEITLTMFRAPEEAHVDTLVFQSLLGDGAGAAIVGSDPDACSERPLFEMLSSAQATMPGTEHAFTSKLGKCGFAYGLSGELPSLVAHNIEDCLVDAIRPLRLRCDWNDLFWVMHPGGHGILDAFEVSLKLEESKLKASRWVLSEYGHMSGVTIIFVLDEMRRHLQKAAAHQDGESSMEKEEESKLGAMVAVGPGLTLETMLLRAIGN